MSPELCVCFQIFLKVILSKREKRAGAGTEKPGLGGAVLWDLGVMLTAGLGISPNYQLT